MRLIQRLMPAVLVLVAVAATSPAHAAQGESLQKSARAFFEALVAGDAEKATGLVLSHSEMKQSSTKAGTQEKYEADVGAFVQRWIGQLKELRSGGEVSIGKIVVTDVLLLPAGGKRPRALTVGVVRPVLRVGDEEREVAFPFYLLETDGRWRVSIKK